MANYEKGNRIIEFEEEGVTLILPHAMDTILVRREPTFKKYDDETRRNVIQVSLLDESGAIDEKKSFGDNEITLIVYYTYADVVRAKDKGSDKPYLLIHDGNKWHKPHEKGKLIYQSVSGNRKWVGSMMVKMKAWDDPLIGVGP